MIQPAPISPLPHPPRQVYVRAVGPKLRKLLYVVFALVAVLGANSVYMGSITALEWVTKLTYQTPFYLYMVLAHVGLGLVLIVPFVIFGLIHLLNSRNRRNRRAVRIGYALFFISLAVLITGLLLVRVVGVFDLKQPLARSTVYWLHVACPVIVGWLYWLHRLAGPRIKWRIGIGYAGVVGAGVLAMVLLHAQDPRQWNVLANKSGEKYFEPSKARTLTGNFISANVLTMDQYCLKCHEDAYNGWFHSAHRFSSFNNPAYHASVNETRDVLLKRDGNVQASRWCAGCHDPVPFFSGAFDNPKFDTVKDPTANAGITCTVCHAITDIDQHGHAIGNADYVIDEPQHYPFAFSQNWFLQYINNQLVKAKPSFHKQTFLKPFHRTAEFCATCHKVHLPYELNHYREFLRGQDHFTTFHLSGAPGRGTQSFYYPELPNKAVDRCADCHMSLVASNDFGAQDFDKTGKLSIHNHLFPSANTALPFLRDEPEFVKVHQDFLQDKKLRVDIFGVKAGGEIDGELSGPLRPVVPALKPGSRYLLETVVRTLKMGHPFTQGTVDSNEVWLEVTVTSSGRTIGKSGGLDELGGVDPWSHFINVFLLDREGKRIDRRNPQDIFTPLYNHQIPPGAAAVVHYDMEVPPDVTEPVTVEVKLQYRKFDLTYMQFVAAFHDKKGLPLRGHTPGTPYKNDLPITTIAADRVTFPIEGSDAAVDNPDDRDIPVWQRWNDYGIGLLLEGQAGAKGELRQAAQAFAEVEKLGRFDGPLNLSRALNEEGRVDEAVDALARAGKFINPPAPRWTLDWMSGVINLQQGHLETAAENFRSALGHKVPERGFDFSRDFRVINELGRTLFEQSKQKFGPDQEAERQALLREAVVQFERTLTIDSEDVAAHFNLQLLYDALGDDAKRDEHKRLHAKYKPDDNAREVILKARQIYPAANHAAESVVIYPLRRPGAPGLAGPAVADNVNAIAGENP